MQWQVNWEKLAARPGFENGATAKAYYEPPLDRDNPGYANLSTCITIKDIKVALKTLPRSLSSTYTATLNDIDEMHREYAIKILVWLAISQTPLNIKEAADILTINFEDEGHPTFDADLRMPDPTDIVAICTTLIDATTIRRVRPNGKVIETTELRLAHYTVKEYLLSDIFQAVPHMMFSARQDLYTFAAKTSLSYLLQLQEALTSKLYRHWPLSRHAAEFWIYYYLHAREDSAMERLSMELLKDNGDTEPYRNWWRLVDLDKPWIPPNLKRDDAPKPIYYMSSKGVLPLVKQLLSSGADPKSVGNVHGDCLQAAAYHGHSLVVQTLLDAGAEPNKDFRYSRIYSNSLIAASAAGHVDIVERLLQHGANPNTFRVVSHGSALTEAARRNHLDVIRALIDAGAYPNKYHRKPRGVNPIEAAAKRGYTDALALMLPKASEETASAGLHAAYRHGDPELVKVFAKHLPDTTMAYAAAMGQHDPVTALLERGAKPEAKSNPVYLYENTESSALVEACAKGHLAIAEELIKHGAGVNAFSGYGPALQIAAYKGHMTIVTTLVEHGASLTNGDGSYGGPVQAAVLGGHLDILQYIINARADINMPAGDTQISVGLASGSPLMAAIQTANTQAVDWLINHGADVSLALIPSSSGWRTMSSPLEVAAAKGNVEIIRRLLEASADQNQKIEGHSAEALFSAVENGNVEIVRILLAAGADPNTSDGRHDITMYPLTKACMKTDTDIVRELLKAGADPRRYSQFRERNEPPIHTAASEGTGEMIRLLVDYGADINEQLDEGETPLHCAARHNNAEAARTLLFDLHADTALGLKNSSLPIHTAASRGKLDCMPIFVEAGIDINIRNTGGRTPLHWAAASEIPLPDMVGWLMANGADGNLEELETGLTARDLAIIMQKRDPHWWKEERAELLEMLDRRTVEEDV
ncbi:hypothetical protein EKO27_g8347 [Xylaria grammica]|uniref:Uncharacterized protein n=1 Tax=Xylaria grammica TaxID=363999 RepID=A0A439CXI1_9PEZI|nr:hypothetical protein EKO27_g8347 [Xylaria grammica]